MNENSKHLVLIWRNLGPYHLARAEAAAIAFRRHGGEVIAMELCDGEESRDWSVQREIASFQIHTLARGVRLDDHTPSMAKELISALNSYRPRYVAIAGYDRPEMRASLSWAKRNQATAVLMSETKWDDGPRPWWKRKIISRLVGKADAGLVSGSAAGEYLNSMGMPRQRIFRQYGAVDNAFYEDQSAYVRMKYHWPPPERQRYFIACCRFIERRKNLLGLLEAYRQYRGQVESPWELAICGDGQDRKLIERKIHDEQIAGVTLTGFKQATELAELYAGACCFVHSAFREAWGLVVNEAMAAGLPVLVSRRTGCAYDLVHEGRNGYCFDPHNPAELARQMSEMSAASDQRLLEMSQESQRIISRFGVDAFAEGLLSAIGLQELPSPVMPRQELAT